MGDFAMLLAWVLLLVVSLGDIFRRGLLSAAEYEPAKVKVLT